jgi:hypothetical protein
MMSDIQVCRLVLTTAGVQGTAGRSDRRRSFKTELWGKDLPSGDNSNTFHSLTMAVRHTATNINIINNYPHFWLPLLLRPNSLFS